MPMHEDFSLTAKPCSKQNYLPSIISCLEPLCYFYGLSIMFPRIPYKNENIYKWVGYSSVVSCARSAGNKFNPAFPHTGPGGAEDGCRGYPRSLTQDPVLFYVVFSWQSLFV